MNLRKLITFILAFALTLSLAACGSKDNDKKTDSDVQNDESSETNIGGTPEPLKFIPYTVDGAEIVKAPNRLNKIPDIYVSPNGDDINGDGSEEKPFATLERARTAVRELPKTEDIVVEFADGFYFMNETVMFDEFDSGNENCTIFYQAAQGAVPIFSGGRIFNESWTQLNAGELAEIGEHASALTVYKAPLTRDDKLRAIYVNGERARMTRVEGVRPATGAVQNSEEANLPVFNYFVGERDLCLANDYDCGVNVNFNCPNESHGAIKDYIWDNYINMVGATLLPSAVIPHNTRNPQNIELSARQGAKWVYPLVCVESLNATSATEIRGERQGAEFTRVNLQMPFGAIAQTTGHQWGCQYSRITPHVVYNVFENLKNPGDFYFDQAASTLYYIPREGDNMADAYIIIPELVTFIEMNGSYNFDKPLTDEARQMTSQNYIEYITFSGISFRYGDWNLHEIDGSKGYSTVQGVISNNNLGARGNRNWHDDMYRAYGITPSMVLVNTARNIRFVDGEFSSSNVNGIHFENDVHNSEITGNYFYQVGHGGVIVGHLHHIYENDGPEHQVLNKIYPNNHDVEQDRGQRVRTAGPDKEKFRYGTERIPNNIYITNNMFYQVGYMFHNTNNITTFFTRNINIHHNFVYDCPYGAFSIGWGWCDWDGVTNDYGLLGKPTTTSQNNHAHYNRAEEFCKTLDDSGGIYTLGRQGEEDWVNYSTMNYNFINGRRGDGPLPNNWWMNGFHPDEGSRFIEFRGNVTQRISRNDYEFNNFARKGDMRAIEGFSDMESRMDDAPGLTIDLHAQTDRIWPQAAHDIIMNSGPQNHYAHLIPKHILPDTERELASNIRVSGGTTLNRRGLLAQDDEVWLVPVGEAVSVSSSTVFNEGTSMTKSAGNAATMPAPQENDEYKLLIKYADGTWSPPSYFTLYVS